jgi:hypothetical protein
MLSTALLLAGSMVVGQSENTAPKVPADALRQFEQLLGDWKVEGKVNDAAVKATYSAKWAPGKHMIICTMTWSGPEGYSVGTGINGWDGAEKQIVTSEFWSDGWSHHRRFRIASPTLWESTESKGVTGDNKRLAGKARLMFSGPDKLTWTSSSKIEGEASEEQVVLHFQRK